MEIGDKIVDINTGIHYLIKKKTLSNGEYEYKAVNSSLRRSIHFGDTSIGKTIFKAD